MIKLNSDGVIKFLDVNGERCASCNMLTITRQKALIEKFKKNQKEIDCRISILTREYKKLLKLPVESSIPAELADIDKSEDCEELLRKLLLSVYNDTSTILLLILKSLHQSAEGVNRFQEMTLNIQQRNEEETFSSTCTCGSQDSYLPSNIPHATRKTGRCASDACVITTSFNDVPPTISSDCTTVNKTSDKLHTTRICVQGIPVVFHKPLVSYAINMRKNLEIVMNSINIPEKVDCGSQTETCNINNSTMVDSESRSYPTESFKHVHQCLSEDNGMPATKSEE